VCLVEAQQHDVHTYCSPGRGSAGGAGWLLLPLVTGAVVASRARTRMRCSVVIVTLPASCTRVCMLLAAAPTGHRLDHRVPTVPSSESSAHNTTQQRRTAIIILLPQAGRRPRLAPP
jgi:hypothetical protein